MAMKVQVHQDKRYYDPQDQIPDGTILDVIKKWWYMHSLEGVLVIYNSRKIFLAFSDCTVISV